MAKTEDKYVPRAKKVYLETIRAALKEEFGYTNEMQVPKLDKIVVNMGIGEATKKADVLLIELADPAQPPIYKAEIAPNLSAGKTLCFCHGFNVLYGAIQPPKNVNTVLYVPNAPGHFVREKYKKGEGIYGCVSVDHDATGNAKEIVLAIAKAVGSCRAGVGSEHRTET